MPLRGPRRRQGSRSGAPRSSRVRVRTASPLATTTSAGWTAPDAVRTATARPPRTTISSAPSPQAITTPSASSARTSASTTAYTPPSAYHTPSASCR